MVAPGPLRINCAASSSFLCRFLWCRFVSSSMAVSFPGEILLEIFSRLPRKPLHRFKIVSKEWERLIKEAASLPFKSTDFGYFLMQVRRSNSNHEYPIFYRLDDNGALAVQDSPSFRLGSLMGFSNGVVFEPIRNRRGLRLHLYNPFTKHHTSLPQYDTDHILAAFGLAPHPETNHFKFIAVLFYSDPGRTQSRCLKVGIFDSETIEWKTKLATFSDESYKILDECSPRYPYDSCCLCFEQSMYWIQCLCLIVFCLKTETFRVLYLPKTSKKYAGVLWESEGRLKYTQFCPMDGLRIWVFSRVAKIGENWDVISNISVPALNSLLPENDIFDRVLAFNEHLQMFHLVTMEGLRVYYDISNNKMTLVSPVAHGKDFSLAAFRVPQV